MCLEQPAILARHCLTNMHKNAVGNKKKHWKLLMSLKFKCAAWITMWHLLFKLISLYTDFCLCGNTVTWIYVNVCLCWRPLISSVSVNKCLFPSVYVITCLCLNLFNLSLFLFITVCWTVYVCRHLFMLTSKTYVDEIITFMKPWEVIQTLRCN